MTARTIGLIGGMSWESVLDSSRQAYVGEIEELGRRGAEAVILGCTEIDMLVDEQSSPLPTVDTTAIHAQAAADFCIGED